MTDRETDAVRDMVRVTRLPEVTTPKRARARMRSLGYTDAEILTAVNQLITSGAPDRRRAIGRPPKRRAHA